MVDSDMALGPRTMMALVALVSLVMLVLLVAPFATPYWWDAGAVYVPGAKWIAEHGFDARPGVFPSDFSRGHTPLFFLVVAAVFRAAGPGPIGGHVLMLGFGWMTLLYTYALGRWMAGPLAGVMATVLFLTEPLFLTMSSDVLPEIALTALTLATFYAFARGKMLECAAWGTLVVLVKETGVACPLAIAGAIAFDALRRRELRDGARRAGLALVPVGVLAMFFVYQKWAEGWFVLPYHADLFHAAHSLIDQLGKVLESIFIVDGRVIVLVAAAIAFALRRKNAFTEREGIVVIALGLHAIANIAFFTKMSFLERYTLSVHADAAIVIALLLVPSAASMRTRALGLLPIAITIVVAIARRESGNDFVSGETSFRYLHAVHAYESLYKKLESEGGAPVVLTQWPITDALRDPYLGWVTHPFRAIDVAYDGKHKVPTRIIAVIGLSSYDRLVHEAQSLGFHLHERTSEASAAIELWGP